MTSGDINHGVSSLEVGPRRQGKGVQLLALTGFLVKRGERPGRLTFNDVLTSHIRAFQAQISNSGRGNTGNNNSHFAQE